MNLALSGLQSLSSHENPSYCVFPAIKCTFASDTICAAHWWSSSGSRHISKFFLVQIFSCLRKGAGCWMCGCDSSPGGGGDGGRLWLSCSSSSPLFFPSQEWERERARCRVKWREFRIIDHWLPALGMTSQVRFPSRVSVNSVALGSSEDLDV